MEISVVIAVYQGARTIGRAIDSVLAQTHQPAQLIIVDDGSYDDLAEALKPYSDAVTLLQQQNQGLSAARNRGVLAATTEWCVLLDADDWWGPRRLELISERAAITPTADIITTDAHLVRGSQLGSTYYGARQFPPADHQRVEILRRNFIFSSTAFRRQRLIDAGLFDLTTPHQTEYDGWVHMILRGSRATLIEQPEAYYVQHSTNMSADVERTCAGVEHLARRLFSSSEYELSRSELRALREHVRLARARATIYRAARTIGESDGNSRGDSFRAARCAEAPAALRLKFLAASVAPHAARRRMAQRLPGTREDVC